MEWNLGHVLREVYVKLCIIFRDFKGLYWGSRTENGAQISI
jgi:hypothetical protein